MVCGFRGCEILAEGLTGREGVGKRIGLEENHSLRYPSAPGADLKAFQGARDKYFKCSTNHCRYENSPRLSAPPDGSIVEPAKK
jgi:hypothetical protein